MRLIDADAIPVVSADPYEEAGFRGVIEDMPTIDPVKHGKWELVDGAEPMRYGCSECKRMSYTQDNYCSYCGAKMEASDETY